MDWCHVSIAGWSGCCFVYMLYIRIWFGYGFGTHFLNFLFFVCGVWSVKAICFFYRFFCLGSFVFLFFLFFPPFFSFLSYISFSFFLLFFSFFFYIFFIIVFFF
jgi:hypothetical protein